MRLAAMLAVSLALAAPAAAAPPREGLVVPGASLGKVRLGMTRAQVLALWGADHGLCRDCRLPTWYYNWKPFTPEGVGVEFTRGRVSGAWTNWSPAGWRTNRGLAVGDPEARVTELYGVLTTSQCSGYSALMLPRARVITSFYVVDGKVWGFGLSRPGARVCR